MAHSSHALLGKRTRPSNSEEVDDGDEEGGGGGGGAAGEFSSISSPRDVRRLLSLLTKALDHNTLMRSKFGSEPSKFLESELALNDVLEQAKVIAAHVTYYHVLVEENAVATIATLLAHENSDVAAQAVAVLREWLDDPLAGVPDNEVEEATKAAMSLADAVVANLAEDLCRSLLRWDENEDVEKQAVSDTLGAVEALVELRGAAAANACMLERSGALATFLLSKLHGGEQAAKRAAQGRSAVEAALAASKARDDPESARAEEAEHAAASIAEPNAVAAADLLSQLLVASTSARGNAGLWHSAEGGAAVSKLAKLTQRTFHSRLDALLSFLAPFMHPSAANVLGKVANGDALETARCALESLCTLAMEPTHAAHLVSELEALELLVSVLKAEPDLRLVSLRAITFILSALTNPSDACSRFVESAGLKPLFNMLMGKLPLLSPSTAARTKPGAQRRAEKECAERCVSVIAALLEGLSLALTSGDDGAAAAAREAQLACKERVLGKLLEGNCAKLDRVLDIFARYHSSVRAAEAHLPGAGEGDEVLLMRRFDAGLDALRACASVLSHAYCTGDDRLIGRIVTRLGGDGSSSPAMGDVVAVVAEWATELMASMRTSGASSSLVVEARVRLLLACIAQMESKPSS
ncbi:beta-catenin [Pseudoscourfieldia marina]